MKSLPQGWSSRRLGDALELLVDHRGKTPGKLGGEFQDNGVPVISAIHIKSGQVDFSRRERFVSYEMFQRWMPERLRRGDVLLTSEAPMGSVALVPSDAPLVLSQRLFALRGRVGLLDNRYLRWALEAPQIRDQLDRRSSGTTVTGIRQSELVQVELPLPPISVQRQVVEILEEQLSYLDAADATMNAASERAKALRLAATASAVDGSQVVESDECGTQELSFGGAIMKLPRVWRRSNFGLEAKLVEYGTSAKASVKGDDDDVPVLRMGNIQNGRLNWGSLKYLPTDHVDLPKLLLEKGDLLFNRTNSAELVGKSAVFDEDVRATFASYLIRVRFLDTVDPRWVNMVVNSAWGRAYISSVVSQQVGQANVNGTKLKAFPLPVPPLDEQLRRIDRFSAYADCSDRLSDQVGRAMHRSATLRRTLLAAAFSGRLTGRSSDMVLVEEMAGV